MSRAIVVRRLTVMIALVAVLCLALPAAAATHRSHAAKSPAVSAPSLLDQFLLWAGGFWYRQAPSAHGQIDRTKTMSIPSPPSGVNGQPISSAEASQGMDPNGHS